MKPCLTTMIGFWISIKFVLPNSTITSIQLGKSKTVFPCHPRVELTSKQRLPKNSLPETHQRRLRHKLCLRLNEPIFRELKYCFTLSRPAITSMCGDELIAIFRSYFSPIDNNPLSLGTLPGFAVLRLCRALPCFALPLRSCALLAIAVAAPRVSMPSPALAKRCYPCYAFAAPCATLLCRCYTASRCDMPLPGCATRSLASAKRRRARTCRCTVGRYLASPLRGWASLCRCCARPGRAAPCLCLASPSLRRVPL